MLFTFALVIAWIPALVGWGSVGILMRKLFGSVDAAKYDVLDPILGLCCLSWVALGLNFFVPISFNLAVGVFLGGWIAFLVRLAFWKPTLDKPIWLALGLIWIGVISTQAVLQAWNFDSGLYHIPAIRWIVDAAVPFGLANLHGRLGFNSAWFSVSALTAQSIAPQTPHYTALASELLLTLFGLAIISGTKTFFHSRPAKLSTIFLVLCGFGGLATFVGANLSSPSTDHPVFLLSLVVTYAALRTLEQNTAADIKYDLWLVLTLSLFTATIKVSMLPLVLTAFGLSIVLGRRGKKIFERRFLALSGATIVVTFGTWLLRNVILTGCLIYPVGQTCAYNLPWAVTPAQVKNEADHIASWARNPRTPPEIVLRDWAWLEPWAQKLTGSGDFLLAFVFMGAGLGLLGLFRKPRDREEMLGISVILAAAALGILYWFFTAPDLRFGASWFWIIGLVVFALGLESMQHIYRLVLLQRIAAILLLSLSALTVAQVGISYVQRAGWGLGNLLYAVPPMPEAKDMQVKRTEQGIPINVVQETRCYWTAPFCTPYFNAKLRIIRAPNGRYTFQVPH